jgi:ATP-dependent protease HslVU (ClpYQ) ATPase subunit
VEISSALEALPSTADGTLDECVLFLDEVDKARIPGSQVEGNSRAAELGLMASLMHVLDGSPVTSDSYNAEQLSTAGLLVVGAGAFENRFAHQPPSTRELEEWGWMPEFAARWTTRLVLSPPGPVEAMELLRSSQRSVRGQLGPLIDALGLSIEIPEATIRYAVHHWHRLGTDLRSASAWLAGAARREIIAALEAGGEAEIVIKPDDLEITRELWRQGPGERDLP